MLSKKIVKALTLTTAAALFAGASMLEEAAAAATAKKPDDAEPKRVSDPVKDSLLELKVRAKLLQRIKAAALAIRVTASGNEIILGGALERQSDIDAALAAAQSVPGVGQVVNLLALAPDEAEPDGVRTMIAYSASELKDAMLMVRIKSKLIAKSGLPAFAIDVEAEDGVVSLSGASADQAHHDNVIQVTRMTHGVREIRDRITIMPPAPAPASATAAATAAP